MWSSYRGVDQSSPGRRGSTRKLIVILNHFTVVFRGTIKVQLSIAHGLLLNRASALVPTCP